MKNTQKIIILLFLLVFSIAYASAARVIKGTVVNEQDEPLIGVTIQVTGTNIGILTNFDGEFTLSIPDGYNKIKISYIGYTEQEITLESKDFYKIILRENNRSLEEVVVVGYGTVQKRDMTSAITGAVAGVAISEDSADKKKAGTTWKRSGMKDNSIRLQVGDGDFIPLESAQMAVQIDGFRVRVLLDCFFFNNKKDGLEGTFKLKLPTDATPYYFAFGGTEYLNDNKEVPFVNYTPDQFNLTYKDIEKMNDREWDHVREARIVSKQKAAKAYEQTVSANIDPALMEWGGADMFSCRVFPLQMNKLHRVVIGYDLNMTEALDFREFILSLPKVNKNLKIDISLSNTPNSTFDVTPLSDSIKNENNHIYLSYNNPSVEEIKIDNNSISPITLAQSDEIDSNDSNHYFASTFRVNLPEEVQEGLATDAVFLLDLSLSSSPDKFNVWLKLMNEILVNNSDIIKRFAVLCFDIDNYWYVNHFQKNNFYNRDMFFKYANTLALEGATNVGAALKEASNPSWLKKNRPKHIFVMSDGDFNWGEVNKYTFKNFMYKGDKVHTYKTGLSGTNVGLLDYLSRTTNGFSFTVTGEEEAKQTAKSFRYKPWNIKNIHVDGIEDFLISGSPTQLYNGQKLIFTGRSIPEANISIEVDNGSETKTIEFDTNNKINSSLASRIYGQITLAYLDNYGYKAEEAATNYSTFYKVPGQYTSFLMLENDYEYDEYAIDDSDAEDFISENLVNTIVDELEKSENMASLGDPKTVFLRWIERLKEGGIVSFDPSDEFMRYLNTLPDDIFKVTLKPIKSNIKLSEQQTNKEQEMLADEDVRFDRAYSLAKKRNFNGDKLKLLSSVVERNASDIQAIRDIAMVAIDWNMGDQAYYMMKRIIDWRQGEALAYFTAAQALAKSGNIDMSIVYYYICLNSDWDSSYGDFESIVALECLKFLNKITDSNFKLTKNTSDFLVIFKKEVEEILESENMLFNEADIVITVSWNVDNTDIDLHVIEPTGEECYYAHSSTEIGGKLTKDVTDGYGPEMYVLEKSVPGTYKIFLNYYRVNATKTASKAKCYINVYKNWGRKTEKVTKKTIFLENRSDKGDIIELKL